MVLIAVIVGYLLGIMSFIVPRILELKREQKEAKQSQVEKTMQEQILDEWLNGANKEERLMNEEIQKNQADIFKEYLTGIETKGE